MWGGVGVVDVVVVVGLIGWVFLLPPWYDDAWFVEMQRGYDTHGAFSNVFDNSAAARPFAYWLEWLQHLWVGVSRDLVVLRVPVGAVTWRSPSIPPRSTKAP